MFRNRRVYLDLEAVVDVDNRLAAFVVRKHLDKFRSCNRLLIEKQLLEITTHLSLINNFYLEALAGS